MLSTQQLSVRFGAKILFHNVSIQFNSGNRYGLVGANGSGKSTFLKVLTGDLTPEQGQLSLPNQMLIGALKQDHYIYEQHIILDVVLQGRIPLWNALEKKKVLVNSQDHLTEKQCEELEVLEKIIEDNNGYAAEGKAAKLLEGLGIRKSVHDKPLSVLSGGYKLRVLLAQVFFSHPDILILDEPTNHLDLYSIKWLSSYLKNFDGTIIVTSHDRDFLNEICTHIADVDYGTIKIYKGDYESFLVQKQQELELKQNILSKQTKKTEDLQGFIDRFKAKASKAKQAQSKMRLVEKLEEEMEDLNLRPSSRLYPSLHFNPLRASGVKVLEVLDIHKSYGVKKVLEQVSLTIERGERVAIIGPNGVGKSTLLEIITQFTLPDQGSFTWGHATRVAYFPQDHAREVKGGVNLLDWLGTFDSQASQEQLRNILGQVLFTGDLVKLDVKTLSGGETARLLLAKVMLLKPNVIILDEPTNHLDIEATEELLKALKVFEGTLIFVSHNRYFVTALANHIIEISYDGVQQYQGTYPEFLEKQEQDHLSKQLVLSQRYTNDASTQVKNNPKLSYQEQKKLRNLKSQLKKKMTQAEEKCQCLDKDIHQLHATLSQEDFYQSTSRDEQVKMTKQKQQLEDQLHQTMEAWQKATVEWEACQDS
jgi:ATPase subunit of ABC transporter with duplicated ATPase domains